MINHMLKHVSVLIPFRPDEPYREKAFKWILEFYKKMLPDAEICIGSCNSGLFCKSAAVNEAAEKSTRNIFVIADADIIFDPQSIEHSLFLLEEAAWVIPYTQVLDISKNSTDKLLRRKPFWPGTAENLEVTKRTPRAVGGLNIVPRKHFEAVGGWDERFFGWGGEDDSFCYTLDTICGKHKRLQKDILHLWHKPVKSKGNPNYQYNRELVKRYYRAYGNKNLMQRIIEEKLRSRREMNNK